MAMTKTHVGIMFLHKARRSTAVCTMVAIVVCCLLAVGTASCGNGSQHSQATAKPPVAKRDTTALYDGIDISSHQGNIDWQQVATDKFIRFAYIKASEGATYQSPHYAYNVANARKHGILVGSYHYLRSSSSIREQFLNFTRMAKVGDQDLIPMIDIEKRGSWSRRELIDSLTEFANLIQAHYGVQPMIYSTMTFYNHNLAPYFNKYPLYIGRYSDHKPEIMWDGKYTIWQFSERGVVPGIDAYVDLCHYHDGGWLDEIELQKPVPLSS